MLDYKELEKQGLAHGFSHVASLDCSTIELMSEVRAMCEKNTCHRRSVRENSGTRCQCQLLLFWGKEQSAALYYNSKR